MQDAFPFSFDLSIQQALEQAVAQVMKDPKIQRGEQTRVIKSRADEQIIADVIADTYYKELAKQENALYLSEESLNRLKKFSPERLTFICDPIDGSSEFSRIGPLHSPLTTAIMAIKEGKIVAAVVGDIWRREIYGLIKSKHLLLYVRTIDDSVFRYLSISHQKQTLSLKQSMIAAYAPTYGRMQLLEPLFREGCPYIHNNGGHPFALRIVAGISTKSYAASIELEPVGLWEHIGSLLASVGGATVKRSDGKSLVLDPTIKQTSITAANKKLATDIIRALRTSKKNN